MEKPSEVKKDSTISALTLSDLENDPTRCALTGDTEAPLLEVVFHNTPNEKECVLFLSEEGVREIKKHVLKTRNLTETRRNIAAARDAEARGEAPPDYVPPELTGSQQVSYDGGFCPFCGESIKGWRPPAGGPEGEIARTLETQGREYMTGHKKSCPQPKFRIPASEKSMVSRRTNVLHDSSGPAARRAGDVM